MEALRKFKRTFSDQGNARSQAEAANSRLRALHQIISLTNDRLEATIAEYEAQADKSDFLQEEIDELQQKIKQFYKEEEVLRAEVEEAQTTPKQRTRSRSRSRADSGVRISVDSENEHMFSSHTWLKPTYCDQCSKFIVFGSKCSTCGFRCHNNCVPFVRPACGLTQNLTHLAHELLSQTSQSPKSPVSDRGHDQQPISLVWEADDSVTRMRKVKSAPRLQRVTSLTPQVSMFSIAEEGTSAGPRSPQSGISRVKRRFSLESSKVFGDGEARGGAGGRVEGDVTPTGPGLLPRRTLSEKGNSPSMQQVDEREEAEDIAHILRHPSYGRSSRGRNRFTGLPLSPDRCESDEGSTDHLQFTAASSADGETLHEYFAQDALLVPRSAPLIQVQPPSVDFLHAVGRHERTVSPRRAEDFHESDEYDEHEGDDILEEVSAEGEDDDYYGEDDEFGSEVDEEHDSEEESGQDDFQSNDSLADFEVNHDELVYGECAGSGSFGTVYKGYWHGPVAIKKLNFNEPSEQQLYDFRNEVSVLMKCRHENIILFMGACTIAPNFCIVTEWCEGSTLYNLLHIKEVKMSIEEILETAKETSRGMGYLHAKEIIHRDLKSANIFLDQNLCVRIGDFGLAAAKSLWQGNQRIESPAGSILWMAPEVIRLKKDEGNPYTMAADVYSFGIVMYEMLSGELPYQGYFPDQIMFLVGMGMLKPDMSRLRNDTPPFVRDMVQKCLARDASERPSFHDISQTIETFIATMRRPALKRSDSYPPRRVRSISRSDTYDPYLVENVAGLASPRTLKASRRRGNTVALSSLGKRF